MQTTLFRKLAKKKPFFEKSLSADSGYYAVIEALWTLEPCGANRQTSFEKNLPVNGFAIAVPLMAVVQCFHHTINLPSISRRRATQWPEVAQERSKVLYFSVNVCSVPWIVLCLLMFC